MHSPLLNIQFPANAFTLYEELFKLVSYEFFPTEEIYPLYFDFPDKGFLNEKFDRLRYESFHSIMLLGSPFLIMIWLIFQYPVYLLLRVCKLRFSWPKKILNYLWKLIFWKQWIVFTDSIFLELAIITLLQAEIASSDWLENSSVFASFMVWLLIIFLLL